MKQGLLLRSPCPHSLLSPPSLPFLSLSIPRTKHTLSPIAATLDSTTTREEQQLLTARERRQLRNEKRESKAGYNWREEVEERFIKKPKKKPTTSMAEELNLDKLALLGPQWWIVRVSRIRGDETSDVLARLLARNFPQMDFKVTYCVLYLFCYLYSSFFSFCCKWCCFCYDQEPKSEWNWRLLLFFSVYELSAIENSLNLIPCFLLIYFNDEVLLIVIGYIELYTVSHCLILGLGI